MSSSKPRYRLAVDAALNRAARVELPATTAHYLTHVLRLKEGDAIALFNRTQGEWLARIDHIRKRDVLVVVEENLRAAETNPFQLTICFAPIKGGRLETIIEKATELGATVLQPVLTNRTIVDKVNLERAESIAREAAEQCERIDWPEIKPPVKLLSLLGDWPADVPLIYGDESGDSESVLSLSTDSRVAAMAAASRSEANEGERSGGGTPPAHSAIKNWAILTGPEGGFTPEEFAALRRVKSALGVGLGPRILRADTAVITLCTATLMAWGDWEKKPRFTQ